VGGIERKRNVALTGFMLSGKTTVGREAASRTGLRLVDLDSIIEKRSRMTIDELFSSLGEEHFRELESEVLRDVSRKEDQLLVPGGGIVLRRDNRELLRESSFLIWLRIGIEEFERRMKRCPDMAGRPLLHSCAGRDDVLAVLEERKILYSDCDEIIDVDESLEEDVTVRVVRAIRRVRLS